MLLTKNASFREGWTGNELLFRLCSSSDCWIPRRSQASTEIQSLLWGLGLPQDLFPAGRSWNTSPGRQPGGILMPEPPELAPFNAKKQWLNSKFLTDNWTSHLIPKGDASYPPKETHFSRLYPQSYPFGHEQHFVFSLEGRIEDWAVDRELGISAQLVLLHRCSKVNAICSRCTNFLASFLLLLSPHLWTRLRNTITPSLGVRTHLLLGQYSPPVFCWEPWPQI